MEVWDIYTKDRVKTGRTCLRGEPRGEGEYHLAVHVWIQNREGKFLISRRSENKKKFPHMYECVGGAVVAGEDSLEGALRESFEEVLPTLGDAVRALDISQEELDGYITSAYSSLAMPMGPFTGADMAIEDALHDRNSFERTLARMRELKETTPEDITAYADILDKLAADGIRTSVGSPQLIQGASDLFDEVDTWMTE